MQELEPDATTELLPVARTAEPETAPAPVFVDASGRRRRMAYRIAMGAIVAAAGYSLMVVWSLLGGPVSPDSLMPFSGPHPSASAAQPAPTPSRTAAAVVSLPAASPTSGTSATGASRTGATPAATKAPTAASTSASASASATGHKPTSAPGKPTSSPTTGHGH